MKSRFEMNFPLLYSLFIDVQENGHVIIVTNQYTGFDSVAEQRVHRGACGVHRGASRVQCIN